MSELAGKAAVVAARARNAPAFALSGPAAVAAADPSLEKLGAADLAAALGALMPHVRRHLDSATAALAGTSVYGMYGTQISQDSDTPGQRRLVCCVTISRRVFDGVGGGGGG